MELGNDRQQNPLQTEERLKWFLSVNHMGILIHTRLIHWFYFKILTYRRLILY